MTEEVTVNRTFNKPWFKTWLTRLAGQRPNEQSIGIWLAFLADEKGVADEFTWEELSELTGLAPGTLRKTMRPSVLGLYEAGMLERHDRQIGKAMAMPIYRIPVESFWRKGARA